MPLGSDLHSGHFNWNGKWYGGAPDSTIIYKNTVLRNSTKIVKLSKTFLS